MRTRAILSFALGTTMAAGLACSGDAPSGGTPTGSGAASQGGSGALGGMGGAATGGQGGAGGEGGAACTDHLVVDEALPEKLSETGLYADIASGTVASFVGVYEPRFPLWSDGATKTRWVYLPECDGVIDTSDMNDWSLPVGARLWKEFRIDDVRIETRIIERVGPGPHDFLYGSYLWDEDQADATLVLDGVADAKGTSHDVPSESACRRCHGTHEEGGGRRSRALGLAAYQLSGSAGEVTLQTLAAAGKLSHLPPPEGYPAVGADSLEQQALGMLHVNCGSCHNAGADGVPQIDMNLWIDVEMSTPAQTGAYLTAVGQPNQIFDDQQVSGRVVPGDAASSSVWFRMAERGNNAQMPPVGSEIADQAGLATLQAWIEALP